MSGYGVFLFLGQLILLIPALAIVGLHIYVLLLAIKALKIYINENS